MNPSEWERAKELFERTREMPVEDRPTFLESECSLEPALRKQVERLLAAYDTDFLEESVLPKAVDQLTSSHFQPNQVIGRYRIGELIGTGGMGQVFRAEDTELDRPVAFKVLHDDIAENDERVRRFIQEAKAASALNHPNILTIHEIGSFEGARFIVSEFVDGETLRERMRGGLTSAESLDIMCQIAAALQAAHSAGIVHRDIKPENIMLRQDGLVKVLDFGLAKLTEAQEMRNEEGDPTPHSALRTPHSKDPHLTAPGLIMGTVAYMSPEQARGQAVDSRTDLWSLGVVFHEMLTGESPFKGDSVTDLVTSIIKHDPGSLDLTAISQELQPICTKALAKDKKARYQTAQDLLQDLQGEKKRMEYAIQPTPFITVSSTDELKTQLIRRRPTLSAEYIVTGIKHHKLATFATLAIVTFLGVGLSVYKYNAAPEYNAPTNTMHGAIDAETTGEDLKITRVAASGQVYEIVISPDGTFVAYTTTGKLRKSIHIKELATQKDTEIVPSSTVDRSDFDNLIFTPDGKSVLYRDDSSRTDEIFRVPISGGTPVKIADKTISLSISPDGKLMALYKYVDEKNRYGGTDLVISKVDGSDERILKHTLKGKDEVGVVGSVPIWSPDSKWLACAFQRDDLNPIYAINVADGTTKPMSDHKWTSLSGGVWMPDNTLVIMGSDKSNEPSQLWRVSESEAKQVTLDAVGYDGLSGTRDGKTLVTVQSRQRSNLWISPGDDPSRAIQVTTSGEVRNFYPLRDGRIAFTSEITDPAQLWLFDRDGNNRRQLTFGDALIGGPTVTPDGKYIIYGLARDGGFHPQRMNVDGSDAREINSIEARCPRISQDSKLLYCYSWRQENDLNAIYKIPIDGGPPTTLARVSVSGAIDFSPRGDRFATLTTRSEPAPPAIKVFDMTGKLLKSIPVPASVINNAVSIKFTPDGRGIAFVDMKNGAANIWTVSVDGSGRPKPLTNFTAPGIVTFRWPYEGKELFMLRRESTSDAMMITNKGN